MCGQRGHGLKVSAWMEGLYSGWGYYHISNALQYSNTVQERAS